MSHDPQNLPTDDLIEILARAMHDDPQVRAKVQSEKYKQDFFAFVEDAWKVIEPGVDYSHNWHLEYLFEEVMTMFGHIPQVRKVFPTANWEEIEMGTTRRMIINVPTRAMKTLLISVMMPAWLIIHSPTLKIATVSYGQDLAMEINDKRRMLITSEWYQEHFGDVIVPDKGSNRKDDIRFESKGRLYSTSVGGKFTGMGADIIILDDPQKPGDMNQESGRQEAIKFFTDTLPTRLDNRNTGVIINIQQRLHSEDLTGFILETRPNYKLVKIPLHAVEEREFIGPLTGTKWVMLEDDVLWEERFNKKSVMNLRMELGPRNFEAQQQQEPSPDGGTIIDRDWFTFYEGTPSQFLQHLKEYEKDVYDRLEIVHSWDMSYSDKVQSEGTDYVGFVALAYDPDTETSYILDAWKKKMAFTQTLKEVIDVRSRYLELELPISILIEKKANGGPILELLGQKVSGLIPFNPEVNKIARMRSVTPAVSSGHVKIPEEKNFVGWREVFLNDVVKFPHIPHDDLADAFSQAIIYKHIQQANRKKKDYNIYLF